MFKDTYLKDLMAAGKLEASNEEVIEAIEKNNEFVEYAEWRMGTCAEIKITLNQEKYDVSVIYDYNISCTCPSLERAIEMAGLYLQLIIKLEQQIGWPSNA